MNDFKIAFNNNSENFPTLNENSIEKLPTKNYYIPIA